MFVGRFDIEINPDGRFRLPQPFAVKLAGKNLAIELASGPRPAIMAAPAARLASKWPTAVLCAVDADGALTLPPEHRGGAALAGNVVIEGMGAYLLIRCTDP